MGIRPKGDIHAEFGELPHDWQYHVSSFSKHHFRKNVVNFHASKKKWTLAMRLLNGRCPIHRIQAQTVQALHVDLTRGEFNTESVSPGRIQRIL